MIHASAMMFLLAACARPERSPAPGRSDGAPGAVPRAGGLSSRLPADAPILLFLGTSLTAGLGVDPDSAYPAVVQRRLDSLALPCFPGLTSAEVSEVTGAIRAFYGA